MFLRRKILEKFGDVGVLTKRQTGDVIYMVVTYRLINRIKTFEDFGDHWGLANQELFMKYLDKRMKEGKTVFTHAHITMGRERLKTLLSELARSIETITDRILMAQTLEECVDVFESFNNIKSFFSWQIVCDLLEFNIIKMSENSWVVLGPGARAGLKRIFGDVSTREEELHFTKLLVTILPYCMKTLGVSFKEFLDKPLTLKHVEHGLCEYEKYFRLAVGESPTGRLYHPRGRQEARHCALCRSEQDLKLEMSPWWLCARCWRLEEDRANISASSFVWKEVRDSFKIKKIAVRVKDIKRN